MKTNRRAFLKNAVGAGLAVAGTGYIDHIQVIFFYDPVKVRVDKILTWRGTPMTEQHFLNMAKLERFFHEWILRKINLPYG